MKGAYTKRKLNKLWKNCKEKSSSFSYDFKRFFVKSSIKSRDFTIISNNCWAGRVYQYLDMPYLSPTVGLYFFAPDYIKFVSDLKHYLDTPLSFIKPEESKYFEELKIRNQTDKPIGILGDVEIVFLHYKSQEEALEKWNRRKERVNFDNIILKFSWMNLCEEMHLKAFEILPFENKILIVDASRKSKYKGCVFYKGQVNEQGMVTDTQPFPHNVNLQKILNKSAEKYPVNGFNIWRQL
jgi:uncharacterized protein (DUF1919 family)